MEIRPVAGNVLLTKLVIGTLLIDDYLTRSVLCSVSEGTVVQGRRETTFFLLSGFGTSVRSEM